MEVSEISFEWQWEYDNAGYFDTSDPLENDCVVDDAMEVAEETDIQLSPLSIWGWPLCNLWFADDILQSQNYHQQHQAKTIYQHVGEW